MSTHDRKLLQKLEAESAKRFSRRVRLTLPQMDAIANDPRLPGEIAGSFGVTARIIIRIQRRVRAARSRTSVAANAWSKLGER